VEYGIGKWRNLVIKKLASEIERVREENASAQAEKMAGERERMSLEKVL
jgi:hypothetical protein